MSPSAAKKKHVRFARLEEEEERTLFDQGKDAGRRPKSALKAGKSTVKKGCEDRVEVVGSRGNCGRWVVTVALCASFLGLGMSISVLGPTFEDLASNVHKDVGNISYIFVGRSAGYIGGSLLGGVLFNCMNPHLLLGFSMLLTSIGMYAIPFCKRAALLTTFMSCIGISMGALDTGGNVLILNTWGDQAGPHMQALHFSFAAGAFVAPIISKLLFGPAAVPAEAAGGALNSSHHPHAGGLHLVELLPSLHSMWAYIIIGSFLFLVSLVLFVMSSPCGLARDSSRKEAAGSSSSGGGKPAVARHHTALVVLLFFFFFAYVGSEVAYGSFIFLFAKDYAGMPEPQAAGLNSLFWGAFAATRGLAIFLAACLRPGTLIIMCLLGSSVSALLLCLFSSQRAALWVCTGVYGASMATTFPSGISWLEQYTAITSHTASAFVVGAALGEMVLPAAVGLLLKRFHDRPLLMYLTLVTATFTSILFPVMYRLATGGAGEGGRAGRRRDECEYSQALLESGVEDESEEEEEEEDEADQWNEVDFEVIDMDDGSAGADKRNGKTPHGAAGEGEGRRALLSPDREKKE